MTTNKKLPLFLISLLIGICLILIFLANSLVRQFEEKRAFVPTYEIVTNSSSHFKELWRESDILLTYERETSATDLVAIDERIFFGMVTGDIYTPSPYATLRSMNIRTGQVEWEVRDKFNDNFAYNSAYVFATIVPKEVVAYDLATGNVVWKTHLTSRSIAHMVATEDELHIEASPAHSYTLNPANGEIKESNRSYEGAPKLLIDGHITYWQPLPLYLYAVDANTKTSIWEVELADPFVETPLFTDAYIFVKTRLGRLYVLERATGTVLWKIEEDATNFLASHVAISDGIIYFLTKDTQLQARDAHTGAVLGTLTFEPRFSEIDVDFVNNTFNVAASSDVVIVYFGDSQQLFAFSFTPDE